MLASKFPEQTLVWNGTCKSINCGIMIHIQRWVNFHRLDPLFNCLNETGVIFTVCVSDGKMESCGSLEHRSCPLGGFKDDGAEGDGVYDV